MSLIPGILFLFFFLICGCVLIYGTYRRWTFLVDPRDDLWPFYSQAIVKKLFGVRGAIIWPYFIGLMFIIVAAVGVWNGLK